MREALTTALMWGVHRPTALLLPDVPTQGVPSEADRLLMIAYKLDRDAMCGGCGQYLDEAMEHDGSMYRAERVVCGGCAARDEDHKDHEGEEPIPGEKVVVVPDF